MLKKIDKPFVQIFHHGKTGIRIGRGFSKQELLQVGIINSRVALSRRIPIDRFRSSSRSENIEILKRIFGETKPTTRSTKHQGSKPDNMTVTKTNSTRKAPRKGKRTAMQKIIKKR